MQIITKIAESVNALVQLMLGFLGLGILAELIFGKFLGSFSIVDNLIGVVTKFGNNGFVGLIAMLLVLGFISKKS